MKRLSILLLSLLCTAATTFAYNFKSGDLYYYTTSDTTVAVTYQQYNSTTNYQGLTTATIPSTVTYNGTTYSVTSIEYNAFSGCSSLTSITIPNSVVNIGRYAFSGCSSLTSITIPNSVVNIGRYAFMHCSSLTSITISNTVTSIGKGVFSGCSSFTSITIPTSVTSIGESAFSDCSSLTSITIPNSVTSIGRYAFDGCSSLTSITIGNSVISIGSDAFRGCSSLPVVDNLRYADTYLVEVADKSLSTYTIKAGTKWIGDYAFYDCSYLTSVTIPNSVMSIRNNAFSRCSSLTAIVVESGNTVYDSRDNCNAIIETATNTLIVGCQSTTIPNSVTSIGEGAFCGRSSLTSITIPNSIIGELVNVDSLDPNAVYFVNMTGWSDIHVHAWGGTKTGTTWPGEIATKADFTYLGYDVYYFTASLGDYAYCIFNNGRDGGVSSGNQTENLVWTGGQAYFNDEWHTIQIEPYYKVAIGANAFSGCTSLRDITCLAVTPPTCGSNAFDNVPDDATLLCPCESKEAYQAADGWSQFNDIRPSNFPHFTLLTDSEKGRVQIDEWICEPQSVVISATPYDGYAFTRWSDGNTDNPRTVRLTQDTTLTAEFGLVYSGMCGDNLYWKCNDKVLTITGSGAMYNYAYSIYESEDVEIMPWLYLRDSIYSVILPNGITYIGNRAFNGCYNLRDITCLAVTPPTCGSNAFNNVPYDAILWCPCEGKEAYQSADGWSQFNDIRRINFPQTTLLTDSERGRAQIDEWICESQSVVISATPNFGYAFTRWSDGNTENPRTIRLTQDTTITAEFGLAYSGMCGDNLYWEYKNKKLSITGSGDMYDGTPWWLLSDSIYSVSLPNTVTYIGNRAFADCIALTSITLPNSLTSIAYRTFSGCTALASVTIPGSVTMIEEYAFEECRKLRDIYCYAATPPTAQTNSFANYNVYVHVPCASLDAYDMDAVFGSFKYVECIGSEDADITDKTVTVVPGNADATFTWPITDGAETYTLVITKCDITFCTLVFNAQGQLVSIAFKPARQNGPSAGGDAPIDRDSSTCAPGQAEQTANGFRFTVTNLSEGTAYAYTLTVRNAANSILETYTGEFTTLSSTSTGINESAGEDACAPGQAVKVLQDGQVVIIRNGETYDMMGQRL